MLFQIYYQLSYNGIPSVNPLFLHLVCYIRTWLSTSKYVILYDYPWNLNIFNNNYVCMCPYVCMYVCIISHKVFNMIM